MVCAAHRSAVTGSIGTFQLFFVLFIIFFPAFLTARNLFKSTGRFFSRVIVAVARAVSTKFITLICVFIFIKALTLAIETPG